MSDSGSGSGSNGNPAGPPTPPPAQGPSPLPPPPAAAPPGPYTPPPAPAYPPQPPQYGPPPQTPYPAPPQQQPPYQPPAYPQQPQQPQYGAPVYAPPAPQQAYQQPMMQQPGFAPPPAKGGSRTLLIVGIAAVLLIILLAVGGVLANASLSSTYSPGKAVQAYFAAQSRGDVSYMVANANYLKGDNGTDSFFNREAVSAMVGQKENKDVSGVSVSSTVQVDSSTSKVTVAMSWNGNQETETYTVHKDPTRTHFVFYNDWKLDVPASTVTITLPNQAGAVQVDGIDLPSGASTVSVIQGYHTVTMQKTDIYDLDNETVNAIDSTASVSIAGKWSADALATAKATVKDAFNNVTCDVNKYVDCPNHTYHPKAGTYEILEMPGGNVNAYSSWIFTFTGDPTANMQLTPTTTTDQIKESGTCSTKLVVDGKSTYNYTGTWNGVLTITGTSFYSNIEELCDTSRA